MCRSALGLLKSQKNYSSAQDYVAAMTARAVHVDKSIAQLSAIWPDAVAELLGSRQM